MFEINRDRGYFAQKLVDAGHLDQCRNYMMCSLGNKIALFGMVASCN